MIFLGLLKYYWRSKSRSFADESLTLCLCVWRSQTGKLSSRSLSLVFCWVSATPSRLITFQSLEVLQGTRLLLDTSHPEGKSLSYYGLSQLTAWLWILYKSSWIGLYRLPWTMDPFSTNSSFIDLRVQFLLSAVEINPGNLPWSSIVGNHFDVCATCPPGVYL